MKHRVVMTTISILYDLQNIHRIYDSSRGQSYANCSYAFGAIMYLKYDRSSTMKKPIRN